MTPEQWVTLGTIDAHGSLTMAAEEHRFEVDLIVRRPGQPDATVSREYVSKDAASTDKAAKEVWQGMDAGTLARMHPVNDGK
jgi:hypothetical protein